jgi:hypothetical protein
MFWADVPAWVSAAVVGATVFAASGVVGAIQVARRRSVGPAERPVLGAWPSAALLGGWMVVAYMFAGAGAFRADPQTVAPPIVFGVATPILVGCALFTGLPKLRRLAGAVPAHWALAAQAPRVFGFTFLALMARDQLPGVFANRAGYGDIFVGAVAPLVAYWYLRRKPGARPLAIGFNVLGLLDLAVAIGTGILAAPSPLRHIFTTPSTEIMTVLPMVMVPVFLVPLATLVHIFSLRQLLPGERAVPVESRRSKGHLPAAATR